jgi:dTDP-glucose 4,6-dehydratase
MKLLITGGAGFIGSNYVRMVAESHLGSIDSVIILDKLTYAGNLKNIESILTSGSFEFIEGDICNETLIAKLVNKVDAIINFAAESHVDRSISNSTNFFQTNVTGVKVLLDVVKNSRKLIRFLQVSTDEVYGSIDIGSWDENFLLQPNSPYSASKASADLLARAYNRTFGLDIVTTRCSNNYGPYQFPEKIIPLFVTNLIEDKKIPLYGSGGNIRDWLHVDDHCSGIHAVLTKGISGEIYNIGGGKEISNIELTDSILDLMGKDNSYIENVQDRKGHDFRYSLNWDKIKNELGYSPKVSFQSGLKETIEWYKSNKSWWQPLKTL